VEVVDITRAKMLAQVKEFFSSYNLLDKVISYVKDEGGNLSILTQKINKLW
jgi:hypothetical protein